MALLDGLFEGIFGGGSDATEQAVKQWQNLQTPDTEKMRLELEKLVSQGQLSPEDAELYLQQSSQTGDIQTDPALQRAQMDALAQLQDVSGSGGLTASDRSRLGDIQSQEQTQSRGAREAILSNAQARGAGGSGLELMAQLKNQQDSASRQSKADMDVAGMAQDRALQAMMQAGQLGGQIQGQSFNQQLQQGQAQDAINQFNTSNMNKTGQLNTAARNQAQAANLAEKQRLADANVKQNNQQQQYNKQLAQQDFENKQKKTAGVASAYGAEAANDNEQAKRSSGFLGGLIEGGAALFSDENLKDDIEDFDASDFLDNLIPSKYKYKDQAHGEGKQVGVMAQSIEKEVPQLVKDTEEGKMVDYNKAGGPIFASLGDIHRRLKDIEGKK